jgi:hypothetical protein
MVAAHWSSSDLLLCMAARADIHVIVDQQATPPMLPYHHSR